MTPPHNDTVVALSILIAMAVWDWLGWYFGALWLAFLGPVTGLLVGVLLVRWHAPRRDGEE